MQIVGQRHNHRIGFGRIDRLGQVGGRVGNIPFLGKLTGPFFGAGVDRVNAVHFAVAVQGGGVEGADKSGTQQGDAIGCSFHREQSKKIVASEQRLA